VSACTEKIGSFELWEESRGIGQGILKVLIGINADDERLFRKKY
jgi:hypothetical protein